MQSYSLDQVLQPPPHRAAWPRTYLSLYKRISRARAHMIDRFNFAVGFSLHLLNIDSMQTIQLWFTTGSHI